MSVIAEGEKVQYVGAGERDVAITSGDRGVVIMAAGRGSYVHWQTGECTNFIGLVANASLKICAVLTDTEARRIAAGWIDGFGPMTQFATTGTITEDLDAEINEDLDAAWDDDKAELRQLLEYISEKGVRGPQYGWSDLHY